MSEITGNPLASSGSILEQFSGKVFVAQNWEGPWLGVNFLHPVRWTHALAPEISEAVFELDYGYVKREPFGFFGIQEPVGVASFFVRIVVFNSVSTFEIWQGYIPDLNLEIFGSPDLAQATGIETITAFGLEYLLTKVQILEAWAQVDRRKDSVVHLLDYVPQFNNSPIRGVSENVLGNKAPLPVDIDGLPVWVWKFSNDPADVEEWNATDWIDTLINYYLKDLGFPLTISGQVDLLDLQTPTLRVEGMNAWESIAAVAPRSRGIAFSIRPSYPAPPSLHFSSVFREDFVVGTDTYPGKPEIYNIDLDNSIDLDRAAILLSIQERYRDVTVTGDLARSVFSGTVGTSEADLDVFSPGWTSAQQTQYENTSISPTGSIWEKRQEYDDARSRLRKEFARPFTYWVLNPQFAGLINGYSVFPAILSDGTVDFQTVVWPANGTVGFMRSLPIIEEGTDLDSMSDFDRPFAVVKDVGDGQYIIGDNKYRFTHDIRLDGVPSFTLRMADNEHAVEFPGAGHWFALNQWTLGDPNDQDLTLVYPQFDYSELIFTVCARLDQRMKVKLAISGNAKDAPLRLHVRGAQLWLIHPDTIVDISETGDPIPATDRFPSTFLRADIDLLWSVAALAYAWYSRRRALATYTIRGLYPHVPVGAMLGVGYYGGYFSQINTLVSKKVYTFSDEPSFTVQTGYSNIDVVGLGRDNPGTTPDAETQIPQSPTIGSVIRQANIRDERVDVIEDNTRNLPVRIGGRIWSGGSGGDTLHWHDGAESNHSLVVERTTMESETDPDGTRNKLGLYLDGSIGRWCAIRALWG